MGKLLWKITKMVLWNDPPLLMGKSTIFNSYSYVSEMVNNRACS